jgi:hypothetical protein
MSLRIQALEVVVEVVAHVFLLGFGAFKQPSRVLS